MKEHLKKKIIFISYTNMNNIQTERERKREREGRLEILPKIYGDSIFSRYFESL